MEKQTEIIRSVSTDQTEILKWIMALYVPEGFEADSTYSKGGFYKDIPPPRLRFDLNPQSEDVIQADCRDLPLADESISSMMFDPPFLATTGKSLKEDKGNIINRRFTVCKSETELQNLYTDAVREAARVLKPGGIFVFKCQDKVSSGNGFEAEDLFMLIAKSRLVANWQRNQKHARKFHSFFWVFRKK
jgi:SAM-dependent methyltransferase